MRFAFFCHSVISDWNNGNAPFLRGLMRALSVRGHEATCYEREDNWSLSHLLRERPDAVRAFAERFPDLRCVRYAAADTDATVRRAVAETDAVVVHEWSEPDLVALAAAAARDAGVRSFFHDTHHRLVLDPREREGLSIAEYDTVLAYSPSLAERHRALGHPDVRVLHEAADTTVLAPRSAPARDDVVFIGNWGDGDRAEEIDRFVFGPRRSLPALRYAVYGVRYPDDIRATMRNGLAIDHRGWLPSADVPRAYAEAKVALHVPRRQYVTLLPGTPTIRMFEALACGACLVSLPWPDTDGLFRAGEDYVVARTPEEMREAIAWLCSDDAARRRFGERGRARVLERHTCEHRADELVGMLS